MRGKIEITHAYFVLFFLFPPLCQSTHGCIPTTQPICEYYFKRSSQQMDIFCNLVSNLPLRSSSNMLPFSHFIFPLTDPEQWGGQCDTGRRQSPIDLTYQAAVKGDFSPFLFSNYMNPIRNAQLTNTGHSSKLSEFFSPHNTRNNA